MKIKTEPPDFRHFCHIGGTLVKNFIDPVFTGLLAAVYFKMLLSKVGVWLIHESGHSIIFDEKLDSHNVKKYNLIIFLAVNLVE